MGRPGEWHDHWCEVDGAYGAPNFVRITVQDYAHRVLYATRPVRVCEASNCTADCLQRAGEYLIDKAKELRRTEPQETQEQ